MDQCQTSWAVSLEDLYKSIPDNCLPYWRRRPKSLRGRWKFSGIADRGRRLLTRSEESTEGVLADEAWSSTSDAGTTIESAPKPKTSCTSCSCSPNSAALD